MRRFHGLGCVQSQSCRPTDPSSSVPLLPPHPRADTWHPCTSLTSCQSQRFLNFKQKFTLSASPKGLSLSIQRWKEPWGALEATTVSAKGARSSTATSLAPLREQRISSLQLGRSNRDVELRRPPSLPSLKSFLRMLLCLSPPPLSPFSPFLPRLHPIPPLPSRVLPKEIFTVAQRSTSIYARVETHV